MSAGRAAVAARAAGGRARVNDAAVARAAGGRVLGLTGRGATVAEARARAYRAVEQVRFEAMQFRRDIADRAMDR